MGYVIVEVNNNPQTYILHTKGPTSIEAGLLESMVEEEGKQAVKIGPVRDLAIVLEKILLATILGVVCVERVYII